MCGLPAFDGVWKGDEGSNARYCIEGSSIGLGELAEEQRLNDSGIDWDREVDVEWAECVARLGVGVGAMGKRQLES